MQDTFAAVLADFSTVVYYASYPLFWFKYAKYPIVAVFRLTAQVVVPFWTIAQFVLLPVTYTAHAIFYAISLPFRLHLLERLETIYIYLGIAALIGLLTGAILHFSFAFVTSTLNIDTASETRERSLKEGRTTAEYRAARQKEREKKELGYDTMAGAPIRGRLGKGSRGVRKPDLLAYGVKEEDSWF